MDASRQKGREFQAWGNRMDECMGAGMRRLVNEEAGGFGEKGRFRGDQL